MGKRLAQGNTARHLVSPNCKLSYHIIARKLTLTQLPVLFTFHQFYMHSWFVFVCCIVLYAISSLQTHDHHPSENTEQFHHKDSSCWRFIAMATFFLNSQPPIFHLYNIVISRILYKWNYTVFNLLSLAFSLSIMPFSLLQVVGINSLFLFIAE